jgi:hypothetical protein
MGVAVIVFALNGKRRDWMPRWQQNWYGWSYVVAVVTCIIETVIGENEKTQFKKRFNCIFILFKILKKVQYYFLKEQT